MPVPPPLRCFNPLAIVPSSNELSQSALLSAVDISWDGEGVVTTATRHYKSWALEWESGDSEPEWTRARRKIVCKRGLRGFEEERGTKCIGAIITAYPRTPLSTCLKRRIGAIELGWLVLKGLLESSCQSLFCLSAREPTRVSGSAWVGNERQSQPLTDALEGGEERADHSLAAPLESDKL